MYVLKRKTSLAIKIMQIFHNAKTASFTRNSSSDLCRVLGEVIAHVLAWR